MKAMNNEMYMEIAQAIATKVAVERIAQEGEELFEENMRFNPFYSEKAGMLQMLKMMDISFEFEFDDDYKETAIIVEGCRAEIK